MYLLPHSGKFCTLSCDCIHRWNIWNASSRQTTHCGYNYHLEIQINCFVHPIFSFWFLVTFSDEVTKLQKYYEVLLQSFFYILLGKMGKTEKQQKENYATKMTKIHKAKRQKHGINETFQNWVFMLSWAFCLKVRCNSKNVPNQITFLSRKL